MNDNYRYINGGKSMNGRLFSCFVCTALGLMNLFGAPASAQQSQATVELANVTQVRASSVLRLPGTVISTRDADISAEVSGRLTWVAEVGTWLEAGEAAAIIDDHLLQLQLRNDEAEIARTRADIEYNRRQIKRLEQLAKQNNTARAELDAAESRLAMLIQELRIAEVNRDLTLYDIERTRVTAPFPGIVVSRSMQSGEYTQSGTELLRLVDTQSLEISVSAPMRAARFNQPGAEVQVDSRSQQMLTAIRGIVPVGDTRSRMMEIRLNLQAGQGFIGEAVTVELPDSQPHDSLSVPRDALVLRSDEVFVFSVSRDNKAVKIPVTPGAGRGTEVAIEGHLAVGDPVVVRGAERLRDGQEVKVTQHHLAAY